MCFGTLTAFRQDGQIIHLSFEGKKARVEIITPKIVNIFCGFESEDHRSKAIDKRLSTYHRRYGILVLERIYQIGHAGQKNTVDF